MNLTVGGWIVAAFLATSLGIYNWWISGELDVAKHMAAAWEQSAKSNEKALREAEIQIAKGNEAMTAREAELRDIREDYAEVRRRLDAIQDDASVRDWNTGLLPDVYVEQLHKQNHN